MTDKDELKGKHSWKGPNVWAPTASYEGNSVRQLIVPESTFNHVDGVGAALQLTNNFGSWPAMAAGGTTPTSLHAVLPIGAKPGDQVKRASWKGPVGQHSPADVLATYDGVMNFAAEVAGRPGLRRPQLGALHAVLGYWTTRRRSPATVVMPTGTGKTDTMVALLVAGQPKCLLVLVPSDALRGQIADKFVSLGVLQEYGIIRNSALRPRVGQVHHGFTSTDVAEAFASDCNVIVATPRALSESTPEALVALLSKCSHLFVDEAHHVEAREWSAIRHAFEDKPVVQFTATPFREDGKHLQGRMIYAFPLREAQADNYFSKIDYTSIIDFDDLDRAVATQSLERFRNDLTAGYDHVLMVRVGSIPRTLEVLPIYEELASDLNPVRVYSGMGAGAKKEALEAIKEGTSKIIVCVNMLGEGYDLPTLKVAAVHDPKKSLGVTLQFIGRFARTSSSRKLGPASMFVARTEMDVDTRLRRLYSEDADWNLILQDLTEAAVDEQQEVSEFEANFTTLPEGVTVQNLLPKMSTVAYRTPTKHWEPEKIEGFFGVENLYTTPIGINLKDGVAWCVVEERQDVRWGDLRTIEDTTYQLYILYFDKKRRMLYINHSANQGVFEDLAAAVAGDDVKRFRGPNVYRVMADIDRLVPTNVGVLDTLNRLRRFSMHVGSDVTASFSEAEAGTKSQTNISGGGYREGDQVNISASLKGRIWTHNTALNLKAWRDWCDGIGTKLLDDTITLEQIIGQFILPEAMKARPEGILLALEWPWFVHTYNDDYLKLSLAGATYDLVDVEIIPDTTSPTGPFQFAFQTERWSVSYQADIVDEQLVYRCLDSTDLEISSARKSSSLASWLNEEGLTFILERDRLIENDLLYAVKLERDPFDRAKLTTLVWKPDTDITVESQTKDRLTNSIQFRAIEMLKADGDWDIIIDDDGTGEMADVVALRLRDNVLTVRLVHCKYSHGDKPGHRLADLYEVCGQTQKSVIWRRSDMRPFFKRLASRAKKKQDRTGASAFEIGSAKELFGLSDRARVASRRMEFVIVQPGLSAKSASQQQLELLASTEAYVMATVNGDFNVWCSE